MPRPRYQIAEADVLVVHRWAHTKLHDTAWPPHATTGTARDEFPREQPTAPQLQQWCDRFLDAPQWKQLHAVVRATRRDKSQTRTVRLSWKAYETLHQLANREKLTLSETIEQYLAEALKTPAMPAISMLIPAPKPRTKRTKIKGAGEDDTVLMPVPWAAPPPQPSKVMKVNLWLTVENNNKFVRGRKKARGEIEEYVLRRYQMQKRYPDGSEYVLTIPYETDEELDETIYEILRKAESTADYRHCFIEADVQSVDDPDRSW